MTGPGTSGPAPIGPGRFVAVVGPSGAGKDTLIRAAREALAGDPHYVFPRRSVTRPSSASEDNAEVSRHEFDKSRAEGGFALAWAAHGHGYGIPVAVDDEIRQGRTVICNLSRTVLGHFRARYANPFVIALTAPPEVLEARLAARGREDDGDLKERVARSLTLDHVEADAAIENGGNLREAVRAFLDALL